MSDIILISKVGLYETIRCAICKNPNQTERGCDGSCQYDKELYEKITEAVMGLAEQRPYGEWIFKNGKYRCTACGEKAIYVYSGMSNIPKEIITDFCPKCGADMRKREGEKNESDHL